MSLIKKFISIVIVSVTLLFFSANETLASSHPQSEIEIPERDISLIFNSLLPKLTDARTDLFVFQSHEPERGAVLVLLGMAIKSDVFEYLMIQAPREVMIEMVKAGLRIASLAYAPNLSTIAEFGLDRAREDVMDWLVRNELRVGSGNLTLSYTTYNGIRSDVNFPFILVHNPRDRKIEIIIYSSGQIKPPISQGSLTGPSIRTGNFWDMKEWTRQGKTTLPPFTVKVSGKVEQQSQFGGYLWKESPTIDIDFQSPVPNLEFRELSFLERQLLPLNKRLIAARNALEIITNTASSAQNRISRTAQNIWDRLKSGVLSITRLSGASISSFFFSPGNDETTIVSLRDETRSFQERTQGETTDNSREIEELRKTIEKLERELESARQTTRKQQGAVEAGTRTAEATGRVEINSAPVEDLTRIIHIGPARAREIIRLRPFSSLDDLTRVPGIGAKIISDIKNQGLAYVELSRVEEKKDVEKKETEQESNRSAANPCVSGRVDINSAPLADLLFLRGIGPVIGQRIINHRRLSPFRSLNELELVNGIGPKSLEEIKGQGCAYVKNESSAIPLRSNSPRGEVNRSTAEEPKIILSSNSFSFRWDIGESLPTGQPLTIKNEGSGPLAWSARPKEWLSLNIGSGILPPKESKALILTVNPTELEVGTHSIELLIESNAKDSPEEIAVSITILPLPRIAQGVVITEIKTDEREFIEIYNPTEEDVRMDEWFLSYYSHKREWNNPHKNWSFPKDSVLQPNSYFLIGVYGYSKNKNPYPDWEVLKTDGTPYESGRLANSNGSLAIFNCDPKGKGIEKIKECLIDAVGWKTGREDTLVKRGSSVFAPERDKSISRRKNSKGKYIDNRDNSTDFSIGIPAPFNSKMEKDNLIAPEQITDLAVNCQNGEAVLKWTAPRAPDSPREFLNYEIRFKKGPLERWEDGIIAQNPPLVSVAGTEESFIIATLDYGAAYEFGIVTIDSENRSPVSNIASCLTEERKIPEGPIVEKFVSGEMDSDHIHHPILIDSQESVYFTGQITTGGVTRNGFFAFEQDGKLKWHLNSGGSRFSGPALLPDDSIFITSREIDVLHGESIAMKIAHDGTVNWAKGIGAFYPVSRPTISNCEKIYLLLSSSDGKSGKLVAINLNNGDIVWEYLINRNVAGDISLVIDKDGAIYFSLADSLYSIGQSGEMRWKRVFPFLPSGTFNQTSLSNPVIDGNILYLFVKNESETMTGRWDSLYALPLDNWESELWKIGWLSGLKSSPAVNHNKDVFIFSFSNSLYRNVTIFGYNRQGQPLSGWPLFLRSGGLLESVVIDADNNLYGFFDSIALRSFNIGGVERWQISSFKLRRNHHFSISRDGNLYLGGNRYLYKIRD